MGTIVYRKGIVKDEDEYRVELTQISPKSENKQTIGQLGKREITYKSKARFKDIEEAEPLLRLVVENLSRGPIFLDKLLKEEFELINGEEIKLERKAEIGDVV